MMENDDSNDNTEEMKLEEKVNTKDLDEYEDVRLDLAQWKL